MTEYKGKDREVVIPIDNRAFVGCTGLTNLTIPGNVKTIRSEAFGECKNLKSISFKEGVKEIENSDSMIVQNWRK